MNSLNISKKAVALLVGLTLFATGDLLAQDPTTNEPEPTSRDFPALQTLGDDEVDSRRVQFDDQGRPFVRGADGSPRNVIISRRAGGQAQYRFANQDRQWTGNRRPLLEQESRAVSFNDDLYTVRKEFVEGSMAGSDYVYRIMITARTDLANVEIVERMPDNFTLQSMALGEDGGNEGANGTLMIGDMEAGETETVTVTVTPSGEGQFEVCTVVTADPRLCLPLNVGRPELSINKTGPDQTELGQSVAWNIEVENTGTATAPSVTLEDVLPGGFETDGQTSWQLGDMAPGATQTRTLRAEATQTGSFTNTATAQFEGGQPVRDTADINVVQSEITVNKTGPREEYIFKPATYTISVTNSGDTLLRDVEVVDNVPNFMTIIESGAGRVQGRTISWTIDSLQPGESESYNVRMTAKSPSITNNQVVATTASGIEDQANVLTRWLAVPGVLISIDDNKDPVPIGETTTYTVRIENQGDFKPVDGQFQVTLDPALEPIETSGSIQGQINGQTVRFPTTTMRPNEDIVVRITARSRNAATATARLEFSADFLAESRIDEEPTNTY